MESLFSTICENADKAHWIIFLSLLLTGLNIPLSEDLLILGGGAIAASCLPEHTARMYLWIYCGCIFSAWEAYWLGRLLKDRLSSIPLIRSVVTPSRLDFLKKFYARFGSLSFFIGRFCPGGVRNALFISSGLTKMPFPLFMLRDGCAAALLTGLYFYIGYAFGQNFDLLVDHFHHYLHEFLAIAAALIALVSTLYWLKYRLLFNINKKE